MNWEHQMERADRTFNRLVMPVLPEMFGAAPIEWKSSEGKTKLQQLMDQERGIDGYLRIAGTPVPVSKRVQWSGKDWGTLTIRSSLLSGNKTEIDKFDRLAPDHLHIHAYVDEDDSKLISVYAVRSALLLDNISDFRENPADGNKFAYVYFKDVAGVGAFQWPDRRPLTLFDAS
jgi:hypothetical protein